MAKNTLRNSRNWRRYLEIPKFAKAFTQENVLATCTIGQSPTYPNLQRPTQAQPIDLPRCHSRSVLAPKFPWISLGAAPGPHVPHLLVGVLKSTNTATREKEKSTQSSLTNFANKSVWQQCVEVLRPPKGASMVEQAAPRDAANQTMPRQEILNSVELPMLLREIRDAPRGFCSLLLLRHRGLLA